MGMGSLESPIPKPIGPEAKPDATVEGGRKSSMAGVWCGVNGVFLGVCFSECFVILSTAVFAVGNFVACPKQLSVFRAMFLQQLLVVVAFEFFAHIHQQMRIV